MSKCARGSSKSSISQKKNVNWGRRSRRKKKLGAKQLPETWLIWCEAPATQVCMQPVSAGLLGRGIAAGAC
jgi:hypothetical protein